ncbi:MAG: hypothetical protein ACR2KJ_12475 [Jatrophihabitans sp.]
MTRTVIKTQLWMRITLLLIEAAFLATAVTAFTQGTVGLGVFGLVVIALFAPWFVSLWRGRLVLDDGMLRIRGLRGWEPEMQLRHIEQVNYSTGGRSGASLSLMTPNVHSFKRKWSIFPGYEGIVVISQVDYPMRKVLRAVAPWALQHPGVVMNERTEKKLRKAHGAGLAGSARTRPPGPIVDGGHPPPR